MLIENCIVIIILIIKKSSSDTVASKYEIQITDEALNAIESLEFLLNENVRSFMENAFYGNISTVTTKQISKRNIIDRIKKNLKNSAYCQSCIFAYDTLAFWRKSLKLESDAIVNNIAVLFNMFKNQFSPTMISSLVDFNLSTVLKIIDERNLLGSAVCSTILQFYDCKGKLPDTWKVSIQNRKKDVTRINPRKNRNLKNLKILHITDIHYDPNYSSQTTANCKEALCCQKNGEKPKSRKDQAGFWADYRCDISGHFIEEALKEMKQDQNDIDIIYFTGDCVCHSLTDSSVERVKSDIKFIMDMLKKYFPTTTIYPILGNHDVHPTNLFAPSILKNTVYSTQWLYDYIYDIWEDILPNTTNLKTIKRGGFYTSKEDGKPRIIGLNSNVAYTLNFWILYKDHDFYHQLQWFADTLQKAEDDGDVVHVLSHVPPGNSDSYSKWSQQFNEIVKRYSHIIAGIFVGHVHLDEILIYYDQKNPVGLGFNGGSLTTYVNVNPNYRTYTVNSNTFQIIDFDEYYINVTKANAEKKVKWEKLYSFKEEYGISNLTPKVVHDFVLKMTKNTTLQNIYFKNMVRLAEPSMKEGCDRICRMESLCVVVTNIYNNKNMCNYINSLYVN